MNAYSIDIQIPCHEKLPVTKKVLRSWVRLVLQSHRKTAALTLRFVDMNEIAALNAQYRQQKKPTNVLAFPATIPSHVILRYPLLGDIIICPAVLRTEATGDLIAHWAHIVIHGVLHLLGFDHIEEDEASRMEAQEVKLLAELGFNNPPYKDHHFG